MPRRTASTAASTQPRRSLDGGLDAASMPRRQGSGGWSKVRLDDRSGAMARADFAYTGICERVLLISLPRVSSIAKKSGTLSYLQLYVVV